MMKLHDYQEYAVKFIEEHPVSALLLDMGLGKTITTLTAINNLMFDTFEVRKVLIIGPLRVARDTLPHFPKNTASERGCVARTEDI